jgi:hypothetical protein
MNIHEFALAYTLSSLSGIRWSYPILALSGAAHLHLFAPPSTFTWLASDSVLLIALIAALVELFAHKIGWLDGAVHIVHKVLAPLVGVGAALAVDPTHGPASLLVGALGGANAFAIHGLRATARMTGNAFFLGAVTPGASFLEDGAVLSGLLAAFSAPRNTAVIAALILLFFAFRTYRLVPRRGRRRVHA